MNGKEGACLICGKPLVYFENAVEMKCSICGKTFLSNASCEDGHFVCDHCHAEEGVRRIIAFCCKSISRNPIGIVQEMMVDPFIHLHGPEHHVLVGAALITAYKNSGGRVDLSSALQEMKKRGSRYPGGSCGLWGCCGAAVSCGMFVSIVTQTTPLSTQTWGYANEMTSRALADIAALGGPRCCKRNSFTAIQAAVRFAREKFSVKMELPDIITCEFSAFNKQCKTVDCPFFKKTKDDGKNYTRIYYRAETE